MKRSPDEKPERRVVVATKLERPLLERLKARAKTEDRSVSSAIRLAIIAYLG